MDFSFPEQTKIVHVNPAKDINTSGLTAEWVSMENAEKATFILSLGVIHASTSSTAVGLGVASGVSASAASTTTVASMDLGLSHYYVSGAAAGTTGDVFAKTAVSTSTFNITSASDGMVILVEVNASELGQFTSGSSTYDAKAVRLVIPNPTNSMILSCVCILTGLRYAQALPPSAI
jgi:hypothetical protein